MSPYNTQTRGSIKALKGNRKKFHRQWIYCYIAVAIPLIGYVIFNAFPIAISFASMFTDIDHNIIGTMQWNNFAHFKTFIVDTKFWKSFGITVWLMCAQFVSLFIALVVASLINTKVRGSKLFQTLFFIPYICSTVAVSLMWQWIFAAGNTGVLNNILGMNKDWLNDANSITWCIFVVILWPAPGYGIVMLTAAFKGIDQGLYESASIDGATAWHKLTRITLPLVMPMTLFLALSGFMTGLATFEQVQILAPLTWTGVAGPEDMGLTVNYYIYNQGILFSHMDYAAVMSWFMTLVTCCGSFVFLKLRRKSEENIG